MWGVCCVGVCIVWVYVLCGGVCCVGMCVVWVYVLCGCMCCVGVCVVWVYVLCGCVYMYACECVVTGSRGNRTGLNCYNFVPIIHSLHTHTHTHTRTHTHTHTTECALLSDEDDGCGSRSQRKDHSNVRDYQGTKGHRSERCHSWGQCQAMDVSPAPSPVSSNTHPHHPQLPWSEWCAASH